MGNERNIGYCVEMHLDMKNFAAVQNKARIHNYDSCGFLGNASFKFFFGKEKNARDFIKEIDGLVTQTTLYKKCWEEVDIGSD
tara:strand:- start:492 stop:740 length:249 start_codon:yes stop_codon:yes gene_type:complete